MASGSGGHGPAPPPETPPEQAVVEASPGEAAALTAAAVEQEEADAISVQIRDPLEQPVDDPIADTDSRVPFAGPERPVPPLGQEAGAMGAAPEQARAGPAAKGGAGKGRGGGRGRRGLAPPAAPQL
eukprot:4602096-Heterocapsa_arctica.AAC.1